MKSTTEEIINRLVCKEIIEHNGECNTVECEICPFKNLPVCGSDDDVLKKATAYLRAEKEM